MTTEETLSRGISPQEVDEAVETFRTAIRSGLRAEYAAIAGTAHHHAA